jgi:integrase
MAVDRKLFTEDVDTGLKANKEFTKFYLNCKIDGRIKQKIFDYTNMNWDKTTRKRKAKKDALDFKESFKGDIDINENIKMNDFVEQYFETMEQSNSYSKNKWKGEVASFYKRFIQSSIGNKRVNDIRQLHIKNIILSVKNLGLSPRTQKITLEVLNPIFKSAIANRLILHNPCDGIKVKRPNTRKKVQNPSVLLKNVFIAIKTTFKDDIYFQALFMFALQGRRKSEILTLKWKNIDFTNKLYTLENTKNGEEQTFILPDTLESLLLAMKSNKQYYVFESPLDPTMHIQNIQAQVNKLKKALNSPEFGIHYLRNVVVSAMAEQGVNSTFLSGALGHSDLNTIKKYLSIPYTKGSEAANQTIQLITENDNN